MPSHEESDSDGVLEDFGSEASLEFSPTNLPQNRKIPIPSEQEEKLDNSIISNTPSVLSDKEYKDVCLWVGPSVVALPSNSDQRINKPPLGYIGVHYDSVKAGFTLPLHPLQAEIFNYFGIVPGQLTPNSHRFIISFILVCHSFKITPTLDLFRYMFKICRSGRREGASYVNCMQRVEYAFLEGYPSSIKFWRGKYVFLKHFGDFPFDTDWGNTFRKHTYPASTHLLLTQADQIASCMINVDDYSGPAKLRDLLTQLSKSHPAKSVPIGSTQVYSTTDLLVRAKKQITSEKLPDGQASSSPVVHTSEPSMSSCDADTSSLGKKRKPSSYPDAYHLEQYKGTEEHKRGLRSYVDTYRKSEDYRKALADHLDAYKKSDDHKKLLAKHLEEYKESEEFKKVLAEHEADKAVCSFRQGISVAQVRVYDILHRRFPDFNAVSWGLPLVHEDPTDIPPPESLIKEILPSPIRSAPFC